MVLQSHYLKALTMTHIKLDLLWGGCMCGKHNVIPK